METKKIKQAIKTDFEPFVKNEMEKFNIPSVSLALIYENEIIFQKGYGWQNRQKNIKTSSKTVFRVGSISKLFTAAALMQLQEKGLINIDDPITEYCPELVFNTVDRDSVPVTLRHILSHRAGIMRESPVGNYFDDSEPSISETIKSIIGFNLIYEPGEKIKYSNLGPTVAAYILEKITGRNFEDYVQENILQPLKMDLSSFTCENGAVRENLAEAFMVNFEGKFIPAPHFQLGTLPAGNLYSTAGDLANFMICLFNGGRFGDYQVLEPQTLNEMFTVQFNGSPEPPEFGLGFVISNFKGHKLFWHNGVLYGFASHFGGIYENKIGAIILNNVDSAVGFNEKINLRALNLLFESKGLIKTSETMQSKESEQNDYTDLIGMYQSKKLEAEVRIEDNRLFLKTLGVSKQITRISKDDFITDDRLNYGMPVSFTRDGKNKVVSMKAGKIEYRKKEDYRADHTIPENLKKFTGIYGKSFNLLKIFVRDGRLYCMIEWFYEYPLKQIDSLKFEFPDYGLYDNEYIEFIEDDKGEIVEAVAGFIHFPKIRS